MVNEAHAAQVRELEMLTVDYFAPEPPRARRKLRPIDDKKIRDTVGFWEGDVCQALKALAAAAGRPARAIGWFDDAITAAREEWRSGNLDRRIGIARQFLRGLETMD